MIASLSLFAMEFFSVIENFMLKTNSMRLVISFTNLLPYMRFGLMKQDTAKEMRIVSVSAVKMRISWWLKWCCQKIHEHSSLLVNVRHLTTGYISPQCHVVFDNLFETVNCTGVDDRVVESICNGLFQRKWELYAEDKINEAGNILYTDLLPYMRFGLMKQDAAKETRLVSVSTVKMRISCMIAIVLSENPSLNLLLQIWMMRAMSLVLHQFLTMAV